MLIDWEYKNFRRGRQSLGKLILSTVNDNGEVELNEYEWTEPHDWVECSSQDPERDSNLLSNHKRPVKRIPVKRPNKHSIYYFLDTLSEAERERIFQFQKPRIFYIDIETEIVDGFPSAHDANTQILSFAIVNGTKCLLMGLKPLTKKEFQDIVTKTQDYFKDFDFEWEIKFKQFKTEYDMLLFFLEKLVPKMTIVTGWNFEDYDWRFIMNRAINIGIDPRLASPTNKIQEIGDRPIMPKHRVILDYMDVVKRWQSTIEVKESFRLDFIAEQLLKVKKLEYEGTLDVLYRDDYPNFLLYNLVDTILVALIDYQKKYSDILLAISYLCKIPMGKARSSIAQTEGFLREGLLDLNMVLVMPPREGEANPWAIDEGDGDDIPEAKGGKNKAAGGRGVSGGWVMEPVSGRHEGLMVEDFASLYPTTERQFNISPDSYMGKIYKKRGPDGKLKSFRDEVTGLPLFKNIETLELEAADEDKYIVTTVGTVFHRSESVCKRELTRIYNNRKSEKKKMKKASKFLQAQKRILKVVTDEIQNRNKINSSS